MKRAYLRTLVATFCVGAALSAASAHAEMDMAPSAGPMAAAPGAPPAPPPPPGFHTIVSRMSPEGRAMMHNAMKQAAPDKDDWKALKAAREEILALMAAPKLDEDALERAFNRERNLSEKMQSRRHEALLKAVQRMSLEDRRIFAEGLRSTKLHIPGETVKFIYKKAAEHRAKCEEGRGGRDGRDNRDGGRPN